MYLGIPLKQGGGDSSAQAVDTYRLFFCFFFFFFLLVFFSSFVFVLGFSFCFFSPFNRAMRCDQTSLLDVISMYLQEVGSFAEHTIRQAPL